MRINEVPQDKKQYREGDTPLKKVMYATTQNGDYAQTLSEGWEAENLALQQAWDEIDVQLAYEKERVLKGEVSPIAFYMVKNRMDIGILAAYVGKWQWQVKRHMKPAVFNQLSASMIQKYCTIFNISENELRNIK